MDITHLHLHVRDRDRAAEFYRRWFGLEARTSGDDDGITFLTGSRGFLLALTEDGDAAAAPAWLHFGVAMPSLDAARTLHAAMVRNGVPIAKAWYEDESFASFRCRDADGYAIEVYWESR